MRMQMRVRVDSRVVTMLLEVAMGMGLDFFAMYSPYRSMQTLWRARFTKETTELERWIVRDLFGVWCDEGFVFPGAPGPREYEWLYGLRQLVETHRSGVDWTWLRNVLLPCEEWGHFNDPAFDLAQAFDRYGGVVLPLPPLEIRLRHLAAWLLRLRDQARDWTQWPNFVARLDRAFPERDYHDDIESWAREQVLLTYAARDSEAAALSSASDRVVLRLLEAAGGLDASGG